jgi:hypothetical protein
MRAWLVTLVIIGNISLLAAQAPAQKEAQTGQPAAYKVRLRFRIDANRTQHYQRFQEIVKHLQSAGFKKDKGLEGEEFYADTMSGTIPATGVNKIFETHGIRTVLLVPEAVKLPEDAEKPVLVEFQLTPQTGAGRQQFLADKARDLLKPMKFQEAVGYDTRNHHRMLGWLPAGRLDSLFDDKFQVDKIAPIRRIEVLAEAGWEPGKEPAAAEAVPADKPYLAKVSADLRRYLAGADAQKPVRVEVVLWTTPKSDEKPWYDVVTSNIQTEGRIGPLVTATVAPAEIEDLAALPEVAVVRLPQPALTWVFPQLDPKQPGALPVDYIPLGRDGVATRPLAEIVRRHKPQKVVVIGSDFGGYEAFVGKQLPAKTKLLDFTPERNADLQPEAATGGSQPGSGVRFALALQAAVPADEMLLARIPADAPYQVEQIARVLSGGQWMTEALARRDLETRLERKRLDDERINLRVRRRLALETFAEDETARKAREEYRKMQKECDDAEKAFAARNGRLLQFLSQFNQLHGASTVLIGLTWADGFPNLPDQPPVMRFLSDNLLHDAAWIQAVPRRTGQVWTGVFRDADNDGVMEFAPPGSNAHPDRNFLAWRPAGAAAKDKPVADLPAKAVVQVTLQWQEAQAPNWKRTAKDDAYREPLAPLQIAILRQRDPSGQTLPADLFDVVERSSGMAERVQSDARTAVYQRTVRFQVGEMPGRFAVRIEGHAPDSELPAQAAKLPGEPKVELRPKLSVEAVDPDSRQKGQVIFGSFSTGE